MDMIIFHFGVNYPFKTHSLTQQTPYFRYCWGRMEIAIVFPFLKPTSNIGKFEMLVFV